MSEHRLVFTDSKTNKQVHVLSRDYIPRVGENVQFRESVFTVKQVTYLEDNYTSCVHVEIVATRAAKISRDDNHGNR